MIQRTFVLIVAAFVGPFAGFAYAFPKTQSFTTKWAVTLAHHAILPAIIAFFIGLAVVGAEQIKTFAATLGDGDPVLFPIVNYAGGGIHLSDLMVILWMVSLIYYGAAKAISTDYTQVAIRFANNIGGKVKGFFEPALRSTGMIAAVGGAATGAYSGAAQKVAFGAAGYMGAGIVKNEVKRKALQRYRWLRAKIQNSTGGNPMYDNIEVKQQQRKGHMMREGTLDNISGVSKNLRKVSNLETQSNQQGSQFDRTAAVKNVAKGGLMFAVNFDKLNENFAKSGSNLKLAGSGQHISDPKQKNDLANGISNMLTEEKNADGTNKYTQEDVETIGELIRTSESANLINKGREGMADARQIIAHERMHDEIESTDPKVLSEIWNAKSETEKQAITKQIKELWKNPNMSDAEVREEYFTEALKNKTGIQTWQTPNNISMSDAEHTKLMAGNPQTGQNSSETININQESRQPETSANLHLNIKQQIDSIKTYKLIDFRAIANLLSAIESSSQQTSEAVPANEQTKELIEKLNSLLANYKANEPELLTATQVEQDKYNKQIIDLLEQIQTLFKQ